MKIKRELLLSKLVQVSRGITSKDLIGQSTCFVFRGGEILTFDGEVAFRTKSPLGDVEGAVDAKPLLALLRKLQDAEIDVEVGDEFLVKGKRREAGITMEKEVKLPVDDIEQCEKWAKLPKDFKEAVAVVSHCVGVEDDDFVLTTVHLHPDYMEAGDNYQLARYPIDLPLKKETLVRGASLKEVSSIEVTHMGQTDNWLHFQSKDGTVMSCRRFEGLYPEREKHFEVKGGKVVFPSGLVGMLDKAQIFSSENDVSDHVDVSLKKGKIRIEGKGPTGWYSEVARIEYDGPAMGFRVTPKLFADVVKSESCVVGKGRLKVVSEKFEYILCTRVVENGE